MSEETSYFVAVVGGGPAGLFAAAELASRGVRVVVFNRDVKPGGLAEYGIYPDEHKLKEAPQSVPPNPGSSEYNLLWKHHDWGKRRSHAGRFAASWFSCSPRNGWRPGDEIAWPAR